MKEKIPDITIQQVRATYISSMPKLKKQITRLCVIRKSRKSYFRKYGFATIHGIYKPRSYNRRSRKEKLTNCNRRLDALCEITVQEEIQQHIRLERANKQVLARKQLMHTLMLEDNGMVPEIEEVRKPLPASLREIIDKYERECKKAVTEQKDNDGVKGGDTSPESGFNESGDGLVENTHEYSTIDDDYDPCYMGAYEDDYPMIYYDNEGNPVQLYENSAYLTTAYDDGQNVGGEYPQYEDDQCHTQFSPPDIFNDDPDDSTTYRGNVLQEDKMAAYMSHQTEASSMDQDSDMLEPNIYISPPASLNVSAATPDAQEMGGDFNMSDTDLPKQHILCSTSEYQNVLSAPETGQHEMDNGSHEPLVKTPPRKRKRMVLKDLYPDTPKTPKASISMMETDKVDHAKTQNEQSNEVADDGARAGPSNEVNHRRKQLNPKKLMKKKVQKKLPKNKIPKTQEEWDALSAEEQVLAAEIILLKKNEKGKVKYGNVQLYELIKEQQSEEPAISKTGFRRFCRMICRDASQIGAEQQVRVAEGAADILQVLFIKNYPAFCIWYWME